MNHTPLISVIIPTKNSAHYLSQCLESIRLQSYKNFEIIIVDNFSTDATLEISKTYTEDVFSFGPERTFQKNFGIQKAVGTYICFIDSDMILEDGVFQECIDLYTSDSQIGGVCIREKTVGVSFFAKIRDFERGFYEGTQVESARFFKKEDVVSVGGFEENIIFFEESILPQKIERRLEKNCHISTKKTVIFHQEGDIHLLDWLKKKFYYGQSLNEYKQVSKTLGIEQTAMTQTGIIGRYALFLKNKSFYKRPFFGMSVLFLKTLEFGAGGLGYIIHKRKYDSK